MASRLDQADAFAAKKAEKHPHRLADAQFCFFPLDAPRQANPGSRRGFCHAYNSPLEDKCKNEPHDDEEFPGVIMCRSMAHYVRVHGCMWCGATDHAREECTGPALAPSEIQMTLAEWNRFVPENAATEAAARRIDAQRQRHRDGAARGTPLRPSTLRPRSATPCRHPDGTVEA